jgi:hypothetical protein
MKRGAEHQLSKDDNLDDDNDNDTEVMFLFLFWNVVLYPV